MIAWCSQFWKLQDIVLPLMPEQNIVRFFNGAVAISKRGFIFYQRQFQIVKRHSERERNQVLWAIR
jgi:hypothetical protein